MSGHLLKVVAMRRKRLGRGYGSGKGGHTVGKGQKGQKTRRRIGLLFEGVKVKKSFIKRLPFLRGKGKFAAGIKPVVVDVSRLNAFPAQTRIDAETLIEKGIVDRKKAAKNGVKILGNAKLGKKLTVALPVSKSASESIVQAGGNVVLR